VSEPRHEHRWILANGDRARVIWRDGSWWAEVEYGCGWKEHYAPYADEIARLAGLTPPVET
jgi:hypothetical protein